jgi:archaemetzincin
MSLAVAALLLCMSEPTAVSLVPLGRVEPRLLRIAAEAMEAEFLVDVTIEPAVSLPRSAYYPPRGRYRAEKLLDWMQGKWTSSDKVVGLTASDVSTTHRDHADLGIFGLGQMPGRACVLSTFRLKGPTLPARVAKVAVHELGHTFGLPHCRTPKCVMQDAGGKLATVDGGGRSPCRQCRARL